MPGTKARGHGNATGRSRAAMIALVVLASAGPAAAQDALGTGNALDANLDRRFGGVNPSRGEEDFRARNNIITNNVMGGRGFRGTVGYGAEDAFRTESSPLGGGGLGSDDLFEFRADAAWSNVNFINFGNTYQRLRFGQDVGLIEYRRTSEAVGIRQVEQGVYPPDQIVAARLRLDQLSAASASGVSLRTAMEPTMIGGFVDADGETRFVQTSNLRGLQTTPASKVSQMFGLSTFDHARLIEDLSEGREFAFDRLGMPFETDYTETDFSGLDLTPPAPEPADEAAAEEERRRTGRVDTTVRDERLGARPVNDFTRIQGLIAERFARQQELEAEAEAAATATPPGALSLSPDVLEELEADMDRLREYLAGRDGDAGEEDTEDEADKPSRRERIEARLEEDAEGGSRRPPRRSRDRSDRIRELDEFGVILRHGQQIERLSASDRTRFDELLIAAEERLRDGEYFWAERRFNRALRFVPGHPMATVGLAHSQIGAGLYLAASLTMRSLFTHQPEMIDARYDPGLVPNHPRLLSALASLQDRLDRPRDKIDNAFLYAYVGRLLDDREAMRYGISIMEEVAPDDALAPLLRAVWLAEREPGARPIGDAAEEAPGAGRVAGEPTE